MVTISRRSLLRGVAGGAVLATPLLGGCSGGGSGASASALRVGALGTAADGLNPLLTNGQADYLGVFHLYDTLVRLVDGEVRPALAESIEPNADATEWTIRVRPGVRFHDGARVGAADVAYSLRLLADPERSPNYAQFFSDIDPAGLTVVDDRTLRVGLRRARGDLVETVFTFASFVFPDGFDDWTAAVGSGPYRLAAYEAGGSIRMTANPEHWEGRPPIGELEVFTIADPGARFASVRGGEIDFAMRLDTLDAAQARDGGELQVLSGGLGDALALAFSMNVRQPPFDDPAVRRALKVAVDRRALVDNVLLGQGRVGNDVVGAGLVGYNDDLPQRAHAAAEARATLAGKGVDALTLRVAELTPGLTSAAELLVEQLDAVGVALTLDRADAASYFTDYEALLATPFQGFYYLNRPAAAFIGSFSGSSSFFNVTGYGSPTYDAALAQAQSTVDDAARRGRFDALQRTLWEEDGTLLWGYQDVLDAAVPGLRGVTRVQSFPYFAQATLQR